MLQAMTRGITGCAPASLLRFPALLDQPPTHAYTAYTAHLPPLQGILINGRGYYGDCKLNAGGVNTAINCSVDQYWVPPGASAVQPWASAVNPGVRRGLLLAGRLGGGAVL